MSINRRDFIKLSGLTSAALMLGISAKAKVVKVGTSDVELNAWISIDHNGKVTIINHRAEMGQGSFQAVPQIIAEELEVNLDDVKIIFGVGNEKKYGSQITGGSSTVRGSYKHLGQMG